MLEGALASKIVEHMPSAEQLLFCNSGSEATYHALRLARAVTGRKKVIKFQGCYHGWHDYLAMNVMSAPERVGVVDPLSAGSLSEAQAQTIVLPFNEPEALEQAVMRERGQIAAVIVEPIAHTMGCILPDREFLSATRLVTAREGIILIFDEMVTGFRHGLGGYQAICGIVPDLTTLGKSVANGFPVAAIVGRKDLMRRFNTAAGGDVYFGGTYNAHPLMMSAGLATIEVLEEPGVYPRLFTQGDYIRRVLNDCISKLGLPAHVSGFGSVWLVYFFDAPARSYADVLRSNTEMDLAFRRGLVQRGIFCLPVPHKRNHLTVSHSSEHVARTLQVAEDVLHLIAKSKSTV